MSSHRPKVSTVTAFGTRTEYDRGSVVHGVLHALRDRDSWSVAHLRMYVAQYGEALEDYGRMSPTRQTYVIRSVCRALVRSGLVLPILAVGRRRAEVHGYRLAGHEEEK